MITSPDPIKGTPDHYAYVTVTGYGALTELIDLLGMAPDEGWDKDDIRTRAGKVPYGFSRWSLFSGLPRGAPIDDHVGRVLERLSPIQANFVALGADWSRYLSVTGTYDDPDTLVGISVRHHSLLADFCLNYDFDFYFDDD